MVKIRGTAWRDTWIGVERVGTATRRPEYGKVVRVGRCWIRGHWHLGIALLWTLLTYLITFAVVREHYERSLPHFDSMAGVSILASMQRTQSEGLAAGIEHLGRVSIGWIQPVYGILIAWFPFRTPEWLTSLNFILLALAQIAILNYGRAFGLSAPRQLVMAMLPLVPGVMSGWNGGLADLRRDSQLVILTCALLFQSLAYVAHPSRGSGLLLGVVAGLTQWSRDNAASTIAIATLPAVALAIRHAWSARGVMSVVWLAAMPVAAFLLMAVPYYATTLRLTYIRYTAVVWGFGRDRWEMLQTTVDAPLQIVLGGRYAGTRPEGAALTVALLVVLALMTAVLIRRGQLVLRPSLWRARPYALLLASGSVVSVSTILYTAAGIGASGAGQGIAYLPMTAGAVAIMAGLLGAITRGPKASLLTTTLTPALVGALVVAVVVARILVNDPLTWTADETGSQDVAVVRETAVRLSDLAGQRPVAVLWSSGLNRHSLVVYQLQQGRNPLTDFAAAATERGDRIDLDQPLRPGDRIEDLLSRLELALHRHAHFVLVCREPSAYQDTPGTMLWPYLIGRPAIERLLASPTFVPVAELTFQGRPFTILENRGLRP